MANMIEGKPKFRTNIDEILPTSVPFQEFPKWMYDPETGHGAVFEDEDTIPDDWVEHADIPKATKSAVAGPVGEDEPATLEGEDELDIRTIKARLKKRDIQFAKAASKDTLYQLLTENWEV